MLAEADQPAHEGLSQPSALPTSERERQREIASYLTAASAHPRLPFPDCAPLVPPTLSDDPILTALVQLGVLKLGCERAFLSLIDGEHQYIVAEATRTLSLTDKNRCAPGDEIFLGVQTLNLHYGVCPDTIAAFVDESGGRALRAANVTADRSRYIIRDFLADPLYSERPYVKNWPYFRCYAEVPLVSPLGYVIGGYSVIDDKLREFDDEAIHVLSEIATTIMAHLDLVRAKNSQSQSAKLMKNLEVFMRSESTIPKLGIDTTPQNTALTVPRSSPGMRSEAGAVVCALSDVQPAPSISQISRSASIANISDSASPRIVSHASDLATSISDIPLTVPSATLHTDPSEMETTEADKNNLIYSSPTIIATDDPFGEALQESIISGEIKAAFTRAAELIREAADMEGIVFLDACLTGFGSRSSESTPFNPRDPFTRRSSSSIGNIASTTLCATLASSVRSKSGDIGNNRGSGPVRLNEAFLACLTMEYPRGHVFSADEHGPIDDRSPTATTRLGLDTSTKSERQPTKIVTAELFDALPKARSIIFLPLWHFQKEQWFAGIIGWTTDATHAFEASDITYLSAFGNTIMAEVSRYETLELSRAKSNFISSISHELRSPLHGILASAELLRERLKDASHLSLVDMVESCGATLLDTMNHLLDFSKINSLVQPTLTKGKTSALGVRSGRTTFTDLSTLVEEVVQGVHIGHVSRSNFHRNITNDMALGLMSPVSNSDTGDQQVLVVTNIENRSSWRMEIETGAWKRIVMNIFGNSLKYTNSGYIEVSLRSTTLPNETGTPQSYICFSVKDTGIGMSAEYLKYRLFSPFAQENTLSEGTGLGLSIVQTIVKSLGGKLEVQSEATVGTSVTVLVPFKDQTSTANPSLSTLLGRPLLGIDKRLHGMTLCLILPDGAVSGGEIEESSNTTQLTAGQTSVLRACLTNIATEWLGMTVVSGNDISAVDADVYIAEAGSIGEKSTYPSNQQESTQRPTPPLLVVDCTPWCTRIHKERDTRFYFRSPIGPRKLAAALSDILANKDQNADPPLSESTGSIKPATGAQSNKSSEAVVAKDASSQEIKNLVHGLSKDSSQQRFSLALNDQRVLLVDDNIINLKILVTYFKRLGCDYTTANNGLEALELYRTSIKPFDFVFMDISMPVMDGFTATREIRAHERATGMERSLIIALTGLGSATSQQEAFSSGMDLFLSKPVSLEEMKLLMDQKLQK